MRPPALLSTAVLGLAVTGLGLVVVGLPAGCSRSARGPDLSALEEAEAALAAGRAVEGRRLLLALLPEAHPDGPSRRRVATALMKVNEYSRAADLLQEDHPGRGGRNGEAVLLRLESLIRSGRSAEASDLVTEMERVGHAGERKRVLRAMLELSAGNPSDGAREVADLVAAGTGDADAWVLWAQAALPDAGQAEGRLLEGLSRATDRGPVLRALGRLLLQARGDPRRAADALSDAVKLRPWDRAARLDLVSALRRSRRPGDLKEARTLATRLRAGDPGDFAASLALAEVLGETARLMTEKAGGNASGATPQLLEAIAVYEAVAGMPAPDPATGIRVLQGLARAHVEAIHLDDLAATGPGSHFAKALEVLERARLMDPKGTLRDGNGRVLLAETLFLLGRAHKRVHAGDGDHTDAVGIYEDAVAADGQHLEAAWDLALLYYDFLRTAPYIRRARRLMERCERKRAEQGLPPLDPDQRRILEHVCALDERGTGYPAGEGIHTPVEGGAPPEKPSPEEDE